MSMQTERRTDSERSHAESQRGARRPGLAAASLAWVRPPLRGGRGATDPHPRAQVLGPSDDRLLNHVSTNRAARVGRDNLLAQASVLAFGALRCASSPPG